MNNIVSSNTRKPTVYVVDTTLCDIKTVNQIKKEFSREKKEIRDKFYNNYVKYIDYLEKTGRYVIVKRNGHIVSPKILTPKQYGTLIKVSISCDITLSEFDSVISDILGLWNYPLDEYQHIVENNLSVVVVKFKSGEYRFVEVR